MATALLLVVAVLGADVSPGISAIVVAIIAAFGAVGAAMAQRTSPKAATRTAAADGVSEWTEMLRQQREVNRALAAEIDRLREELVDERRECDRQMKQLLDRVLVLEAARGADTERVWFRE